MRRFTPLLLALLLIASLPSALAIQYIAPSIGANQSIGASNLLFLDNSNTRVGVGTATPHATLEVKGQIGQVFDVNGASAGQSNWRIGGQISTDKSFEITPSTAFGGFTFSTPALIINSSGSVGIGTTSPQQKLDVVGAIAISGTSIIDASRNIVNAGTGAFSSTLTASNGFTLSSGALSLPNNAVTDAMLADAHTISGGTIGSNSISGTLTTTGTLTIGDGGDRIDVSSNTWTVTNGAMAGVTTLDTGNGANELYAMNQNVRSTDNPTFGALTVGTIDSGIGATDVYLMNQNVRSSDSPTFAGLTVSGTATQNGYTLADAATDNLLTNGDFEMNTAAGWTGATSPTIVIGGYSGKYAAQYTGDTMMLSSDYIPVNGSSDALQLEGWFKETTAGSPLDGVLYFGYIAYNRTYDPVTTSPCGTYCYFGAAAYNFTDTAWHKFSATTSGMGSSMPNFPVNTTFVRVLALVNYGASANAVLLVDHVSVRRINNGPLYVGYDYTTTNNVDQNQVGKISSPTTTTMVISPPGSGNLGIGVSPAQKLDVGGAIAISGTTAIDASRNYNGGTGTFSGAVTTDTLKDSGAVTRISYSGGNIIATVG